MKKLLSLILVLNFTFCSCLAVQTDAVQMDIVGVPLKSNLKTKYSAYKIEFTNTRQNSVRISEINCYNKINIADPSTMEKYNTKKTAICSALAIPTLGISLLFLIPDQVKMTNNMYSAMNEQSRYTPVNAAVYNLQNGTLLNTDKKVLEPGQSVRYDILVPLDEKPDINASFQDLKTNKIYIVK